MLFVLLVCWQGVAGSAVEGESGGSGGSGKGAGRELMSTADEHSV